MDPYGVGCVGEAGTIGGDDEWHVVVEDPSDYVAWIHISKFCTKTGREIDDFVIRLNFGLLDAP